MDDQRFDALSRLFARTLTRRRATPTVASVLAGVVAVAATDDVVAKKKPKKRCLKTGTRCTANSGGKGDKCSKCCTGYAEPRAGGSGSRCACKAEDAVCTKGRECCSGKCTAGACGACDIACASDQTCIGRTCRTACEANGPCRIFITESAYPGTLGAALGAFVAADSFCASDAAAAGLTGTFKAWLSTESTSAADRLVHSTTPYVRIDGVTIADDWADLTDGVLQAPINRTALDNVASARVWTGTDSSGNRTSSTCDSWNIPFASGEVGSSEFSDSRWTELEMQYCWVPNEGRLYCVEQPTRGG